MDLQNQSGLAAGFHIRLGMEAEERLAVAVRGCWNLADDGSLKLAEEQPPLLLVDQYEGEPGTSSILYEAEQGGAKPATDLALIGNAHAATTTTCRQEVSLTVGPLTRSVVVTGPRRWHRGLFGWRVTDPSPFEQVPLRWELTAGGIDASGPEAFHAGDQRNPLGRGFRNPRSRAPREEIPVPQIIASEQHLDEPVGFGFIAPSWEPRRRWAGTYDQAWRDERCPLLPTDFDARFHCCAAPGLTTEGHLQGGEPIAVTGCREAPIFAEVPRLRPTCRAVFDREEEAVPLAINTVLIDMDAKQVRVLWRGEAVIHRRLQRLRAVAIQVEGQS